MIVLASGCSRIEENRDVAGNLRVTIDDIGISSENEIISCAATKSVSIPSPQDFSLTIYDNVSNVIYDGEIGSGDYPLAPGNYSVKAYYGNQDIIHQDNPGFSGLASFTIAPSQTKTVTMTAKMQDAALRIVFPESLASAFESYSFSVLYSYSNNNSGSNTDAGADGQQGEFAVSDISADIYVKAGSGIRLVLKAVNYDGVEKEWTVASTASVEAGKVYKINCNPILPSFSLPSQNVADVWSTTATLYPTTKELVTSGNTDNIMAGLVYELSSDGGSTWTELATDGNVISLSGLTPGHTYTYRSRFKGTICTNPWTFTTESQTQLENSDMESWGSGNNSYVYPGPSDNACWATRNNQTTREGSTWFRSNSGTYSTTDARSGNAALLTTIGWGSGNTWAGYLWSAIIKNISPAWLLLGATDANASIVKKGIAHTSRPTAVSFYNKYSPMNGSTWEATVEVLDGGTVIGSGKITGSASISAYTQQTINITYSDESKKATELYIFFTNDTRTGGFNKNNDLTKQSNPDRYEGSVLKIDDIQLIYGR